MDTRANPAFPLVKPSLDKLHLPVSALEELTCWENVELSLLKLEKEQFDILWKDRLKHLRKEKMKNVSKERAEHLKKEAKKEEVLDQLPEGALDDPFIREMEKTLAQGDNKSVREMLKSFKM